jgi:hypothetical protein
LFHDILDKKYVTDAQAADAYAYFQPFFTSMAASHGVDLVEDGRDQTIAKIISSVSWTTEKRLRDSGEWTKWHDTCLELHCIQDADRLDAIGAFGKYLNLSFPVSCNFVYRNHALRSLQYRQETVNSSLELSVSLGLHYVGLSTRLPMTPTMPTRPSSIFTISYSTFATGLRPRLARKWGTEDIKS